MEQITSQTRPASDETAKGWGATGFGVLGTLARGTEVEVLEDPGAGWVRLQVVPEGQIGWIADFLLDGA